MSDSVGRDELDAALRLATANEANDSEKMRLSEAERIAGEVGVSRAEFRAALAQARAASTGRGQLLGPSAMLTAEASARVNLGRSTAARVMAEGQAAFTQVDGVTREVAPGVWRSEGGNSLIQISASGSTARFSAGTTRGAAKWSMILGGTGVGGFFGTQLAGMLAIALGADVSTMALSVASGGVTGLLGGFLIGTSMWKATARGVQARLFQAVERMRSTAEDEPSADPATGDA